MKVFLFDPNTGRRGKQIDDVKMIDWAGKSYDYCVDNGMVEPILWFVEPTWRSNSCQVTIHLDAGIGHAGHEKSYRREDDWVCFCMGEWTCGTDTSWQWIVLPPSNLIKLIPKVYEAMA